MNIKYLFVVSLALIFVAPKKAQAQAVDSELMSIDAFSDDDFLQNMNNDDDDIFGDNDNKQVITTNARTLQNATPVRGIYIDEFLYRWYIQAGGGAQILMGEDDSKGKFASRLTLAPSLSVGYRFNPIFGVRANFSGGTLHGFNDGHSGTYRFWKGKSAAEKQTIADEWGLKHGIEEIERWDPQWNYKGWTEPDQIHFDNGVNSRGYNWKEGRNGGLYMQHVRYLTMNTALTVNLSNLFAGANDARKFEVSLYAGPSFFHVFPHLGQTAYNGVGVFGGLETQYNINEKFGIFANFNGYAMPDGFDGHLGGDSFDLIGQTLLGITYKFPTDVWQGPTGPYTPPAEKDDMNDELNRIRAELMREMSGMVDLQPEIDRLRAQLAALNRQPEQEIIEEQPVKQSYFHPNPIHFAINRTEIDAAGWNVIEEIAAYLQRNPDATVIVTGYADKDTGTDSINLRLSKERSKNVADALVYRYHIDQGRVAINWEGDTEQPFGLNSLNRAVLFYIEFNR